MLQIGSRIVTSEYGDSDLTRVWLRFGLVNGVLMNFSLLFISATEFMHQRWCRRVSEDLVKISGFSSTSKKTGRVNCRLEYFPSIQYTNLFHKRFLASYHLPILKIYVRMPDAVLEHKSCLRVRKAFIIII